MSYTAPTLPTETLVEANIRLGHIEAQEDVTILFAVESGSRAWGFPSPDSDNDVRFFYVRPVSHYLGLTEARDVIDRPISGVWDVNGWDLRKALQLLVKGNATVTEWLSSPLIYRELGPFPAKLRSLIKKHASAQASARHYYGLTKKCFDGEIGNRPSAETLELNAASGVIIKGLSDVNLKKYLYAVRGACAIAWIREFNEVPPMTLPALLSHDVMPQAALAELKRLLAIKATMGEVGQGPRIAVLDDFITAQIAWVKEAGLANYPTDPSFQADAEHLLLHALGIG